jgi:hypothetical protein
MPGIDGHFDRPSVRLARGDGTLGGGAAKTKNGHGGEDAEHDDNDQELHQGEAFLGISPLG